MESLEEMRKRRVFLENQKSEAERYEPSSVKEIDDEILKINNEIEIEEAKLNLLNPDILDTPLPKPTIKVNSSKEVAENALREAYRILGNK